MSVWDELLPWAQPEAGPGLGVSCWVWINLGFFNRASTGTDNPWGGFGGPKVSVTPSGEAGTADCRQELL